MYLQLMIEVVGVSYTMFVISAVPYLAGRLLACCEGVSAFDVLNAFGGLWACKGEHNPGAKAPQSS
jgi:hypothetical protein